MEPFGANANPLRRTHRSGASDQARNSSGQSLKCGRLGNTVDNWLSGTPNQRASVAQYWSVEVLSLIHI